MVTATTWIEKQRTPAVLSGIATIDSGETATLTIPSGGRGVVRLAIPAAFTGTAVTFTVQPYPPATPGGTTSPAFATLKDGNGNTVTKTAAANTIFEVPELSGAYAFTIVSNASEGAGRAIGVSVVGVDPFPFDSSAAAGPYPTAFPRLATYTKPDVTAGADSWTQAHSPVRLFTVTGTVLARVVGVTMTPLTSTGGTGTLAVGVAGATGAFIAATTVNNTTNFVANAAWVDTTPTVTAEVLAAIPAGWVLCTGNIILTVATNDMTAGGETLYCQWVPFSAGATVVGN